MCGIAITTKRNLVKTLANQKDRGLDSLGVITRENYYRVVGDYSKYKKYIKKTIYRDNWEGLCILHHRKASIGSITLDNAHPFYGKRFMLVQNGTNRKFHTKYRKDFMAETDSEAILHYIESKTHDIDKVPGILDAMHKDVDDTSGILIVTDMFTGKILFYADGARESYIVIKDDKVDGIYNYNGKKGFKNVGWLMMDFDGNIYENTFKNLNKEKFVKPLIYINSYGKNGKTYTGDYSYGYGYNWDNAYYNRDLQALPAIIEGEIEDEIIPEQHLTDSELEEYGCASEFLWRNAMEYYDLHYIDVLSDYLNFMYGVNSRYEYEKYGYGVFPEKGFKLAFKDTFGRNV